VDAITIVIVIVSRECHCDRLTPIAEMILHKSRDGLREGRTSHKWFNVYKYDLRLDLINFYGHRKNVNVLAATAKKAWRLEIPWFNSFNDF